METQKIVGRNWNGYFTTIAAPTKSIVPFNILLRNLEPVGFNLRLQRNRLAPPEIYLDLACRAKDNSRVVSSGCRPAGKGACEKGFSISLVFMSAPDGCLFGAERLCADAAD